MISLLFVESCRKRLVAMYIILLMMFISTIVAVGLFLFGMLKLAVVSLAIAIACTLSVGLIARSVGFSAAFKMVEDAADEKGALHPDFISTTHHRILFIELEIVTLMDVSKPSEEK